METINIEFSDPKAFVEKLAADIRARWRRGILNATMTAEGVVVDEAPYREGNLRSGIISFLQGEGTETVGIVKVTAPYGPLVHRGTGIYGPHRTPIIPRVKKALAFIYGGRKVVRRSVRGQKANPFVTRAKDKLQKSGAITRAFWEGFNA